MKQVYRILFFITLVLFQGDTHAVHLDDSGDVKVINAQQIAKDRANFLIIDVRSQLEYEVIHIQGAYNISMSTMAFELRVQELCKRQCKIVTYCNGYECKKSKQAALRLHDAGFRSVYYYPDGIMDWVHLYPQNTVLMKQLPANLDDLVTLQELSEHTLTPNVFFEKVYEKDTLFVDVRDSFQSRLKNEGVQDDRLNAARPIPLARFKQAIENGFGKDKTLLITDAVGRQVVWLQFYLKQFGYQNYYFLKGGAESLVNE